jgi:histone deacetylase complex regulatory component SIN3
MNQLNPSAHPNMPNYNATQAANMGLTQTFVNPANAIVGEMQQQPAAPVQVRKRRTKNLILSQSSGVGSNAPGVANVASNVVANQNSSSDGHAQDYSQFEFAKPAQPSQKQSNPQASDESLSVERKFFDHVKDVLSSVHREHWGEFIKCVELFTGEAINQQELLNLVKVKNVNYQSYF